MAMTLTGSPQITAAALDAAINTELTTNWFPLAGVTSNSNAATGAIGEFISSTVLVGAAVSLTTSVNSNVTSISLTPGDWDVSGQVWTQGAGGAIASNAQAGIFTTTATMSSDPSVGARTVISSVAAANAIIILPLASCRFSLAATTTVFLVTNVGWSTGTFTAYGFIGGRRRR